MALLKETFPGRVFSRRGDINWPPVHAGKPSTLEHLESNIRQVLTEIPVNICQKVVENYLKRINAPHLAWWSFNVNVQTL